MERTPKPQEIYRHFKGNLYQVLTLAEKEDTGETLVIYQALYGEYRIFARALSSFTEELDPEKYGATSQRYRFELYSEEEEQPILDPLVEQFLDAKRTQEKLEILALLQNRITNEMIDTMAIATGIEVEAGDVQDRYEDLRACLLTIEQYELSRDRYQGMS